MSVIMILDERLKNRFGVEVTISVLVGLAAVLVLPLLEVLR